MFKRLTKYFGMGLAAVLPFALVIWVLVFIFQFVDGLLGPFVDAWFHTPIPGVGFIAVIVLLTVAGALTRFYVSRQILLLVDRLFTRTPFVKSLYTMVKDVLQNLLGRKKGFQQPVLVYWPDERAQILGFITNTHLPSTMDPSGQKIAVYVPNAFQFAGQTLIVDKEKTVPLDMSVEEALKFAVSAGLGHSDNGPSEMSGQREIDPTTPTGHPRHHTFV